MLLFDNDGYYYAFININTLQEVSFLCNYLDGTPLPAGGLQGHVGHGQGSELPLLNPSFLEIITTQCNIKRTVSTHFYCILRNATIQLINCLWLLLHCYRILFGSYFQQEQQL